MKNINLSGCLSVLLSFFLISCASSLPPNSYIQTKYFSIVSPNENGWNSSSEIQSSPMDSIFFQKGHGPGNLSPAVHPIKTLIIIRKTIMDSSQDIEVLKPILYQKEMNEIEKMISEFDQRLFVTNFLASSFYSDEKLLYQFEYNVSFAIDSSGYTTYPSTSIQPKYNLGDGLGQYYIYLPNYYKEWSTYYLFIYDEYPLNDSTNTNISSSISAGDKNESIKTKSTYKIVRELSEFIKNFTCIEDSLKK